MTPFEFFVRKQAEEKGHTWQDVENYFASDWIDLVQQYSAGDKVAEKEEDEPYFGWCDVDGCENEGCNGGSCWRETGYWTVCSKHSGEWRKGEKQPKMKEYAIEREASRDENGHLHWHKPLTIRKSKPPIKKQ